MRDAVSGVKVSVLKLVATIVERVKRPFSCVNVQHLHDRFGVYDYATRIFVKNTRIVTTKLTLTIDPEVIERAKRYAKQHGRSLSELVETYLFSITDTALDTREISPQLKSLIGVVDLPADFDEDKQLRAHFEKKHR
jgi:hypothetical protein